MEHAPLSRQSVIERLTALAERLSDLRRPSEGADVLELAAEISRDPAPLHRRAKALRAEAHSTTRGDREHKRRNLEASHAIGMGHILESRGEIDRAAEMFDLAKLRAPFHYLAYAASGFLHLRHNDSARALAEFSQARRLNPLDLRLAIEASRAGLKAENYWVALEHAIDAMFLSQWQSCNEFDQDRRRVDTLARLCSIGPEELEQLIQQRAETLQKASENVALSLARIFSMSKMRRRRVAATISTAEPPKGDLLRLATTLRSMRVFRHFTDEQLIQVARLIERVPFEHATAVFREGHDDRDVYVIRDGTVHITRKTPAGTQILDEVGYGSLFGEVAYLDGGGRSATAFGADEGAVYRMQANDLDQACRDDRELAVAFMWSFWESLVEKVRAANSQMEAVLNLTDHSWHTAESGHDTGTPVEVSEEIKHGLLVEQGLSAHELRLLATYSKEEQFAPEAVIFSEGERGDALYIVVDGQVRISRVVPGMGEESLAILGRGEVFGEMALIDDMPRSADARAHRDGTTVFSVDRSLLEEVLSMDPDAAGQFLTLLCRILCGRLRAMNDRLVAWKVMAAHV